MRVVDRGAEAIVLSQPEGWEPSALETASVQLWDGTLVQVGKSTEARQDLLARFRAALGVVTLSIVVVALAGGFIVTRVGARADPAADAKPSAGSSGPAGPTSGSRSRRTPIRRTRSTS